jgi:hypothetical protein
VFEISRATGAVFLRELSQHIGVSEMRAVAETGLFDPPNDYRAETFVVPLEALEFPEPERAQYDAMFAIKRV